MNKTAIEWCEYTWNPVLGCEHGCPYCYARPIAEKIYGSFRPRFLPERLKEPARKKKPSRIFVTSMGDLFGDWVPAEWIQAVKMAALGSHHTFQFLTKNPKRLKDFNPWPENCWVGTTVTNQADMNSRLPELLQAEARIRFSSHEPLLGPIEVEKVGYPRVPIKTAPFWAIIGAQTGPGAVKPDPAWVQGLIDQYRAAGVPIFLKDNLNWPEKIQEWPT